MIFPQENALSCFHKLEWKSFNMLVPSGSPVWLFVEQIELNLVEEEIFVITFR